MSTTPDKGYRARTLLLILLVLVCPICAMAQGERRLPVLEGTERRFALVIGNKSYGDASLKHTLNDGRAMAAKLRTLHFDVSEAYDVNREKLVSVIEAFTLKAAQANIAIVYYSGHGAQIAGENYLVPTDYHLQTQSDADTHWVKANYVLKKMEDSGIGCRVLILDACRNNPFVPPMPGEKEVAYSGLAAMQPGSGTLVAYATALGSTASDGDDAGSAADEKNGLYTQELLKFLDARGLSLPEVFRKVRVSVKKLSHQKQVPDMEDRLDESPVLVPVQEPDPVVPTPHKPDGDDPDRPTRINSKDGAEAVYIPAGEFLMGTSDAQVDALLKLYPDWKRDWFKDEQPQHRVVLDGYWLYKNLVTVGQYKKYVAAMLAEGRTDVKMPVTPYFNSNWSHEDHPIVNVSWADAEAYAKWAGGELPTEAQWEKGARGRDGRLWPWGNTWDGSKCANSVKPNDLQGTVAVGSYPEGVSPYGCLNMAGNVWEWCRDWYAEDYYSKSILRNPPGPDTGTERVLRGGSWGNSDPDSFRAASRRRSSPADRNNIRGFRVVLQGF